MSKYKKILDKTKCMYFLIKCEKKFKKYYEIWENVSNIMTKKFNSEPVHNKKYLKAGKNQHKRRLSMCLYTSNID